MEELSKLEERLNAALATLTGKAGDTKEVDALNARNAELETALNKARSSEKDAREALNETQKELEALREEASEQDALDEEDIAALNRQIDSLSKAREDAFQERRRSKQYVEHVRKLNNNLKKANRKNVGDASLINASLEAENELLKQERENDLTTLNDLLERLKPLVEGADNG